MKKTMKKTTQIRNIITSSHLETIMEAHNALSAKIVQEAGFKGIWASGLSISAALGVRDNNEASWTQVLEVLEFMSDATSIPILMDGDTGYGNFNNARRLVKKLEQRQIAGVCIEDKLFPKTNSFLRGETQPLADIDEFCGKIKAMKDSQQDDDFVVVSRVEAFIAGWGLREALTRAEAYRKAGADAILMHSKRSDLAEIEAFMNEWGDRHPVIVVPTKYYSVPTDQLRKLGIQLAIWANHNLRASIKAMQTTSKQIYLEESLINAENNVAPLDEVFRLQGEDELASAEQIYLASSNGSAGAIIMDRNDENLSLMEKQITQLKSLGINDIKKATAPKSGVLSEFYETFKSISRQTVISDSSIICKPYLLQELLDDSNDITMVADPSFEDNAEQKHLVTASLPYSKMLYAKTAGFVRFTKKKDHAHGEFFGLWKVSAKGAAIVKDALASLAERPDFNSLTLIDLFHEVSKVQTIAVLYSTGTWLDHQMYKKITESG
jgi:phosphoenolpyruvate phosphomutase